MPIVKASSGGGVHIKPNMYEVRCIETAADHLDKSKYGSGDVVRLVLEVQGEIDSDGNPVEIDAIANYKLTPKSKLWEWAEAFGLKPLVGQDFDTDSMVDRRARALITDRDEVAADGKIYSRVEKIMALDGGNTTGASVSTSPTIVNADGTPNWGAFWPAIVALGLTKQHVFDHMGTMDLTDKDGADIAIAYEELKAKATS